MRGHSQGKLMEDLSKQKERKRIKGCWGETDRLWNKGSWAKKGRRRASSESAVTPKRGEANNKQWEKEAIVKKNYYGKRVK